ncbi:hypothetical protein ERN12_10335 [Rhodobacteraceae bacterium]|nr:hypothetical protein ERN12_10335 [Paracoccaceae bacterium]
MIRPELSRALRRHQEVIAAGLAALFGLWLVWLGGLILGPLGVICIIGALCWAVIAWRRGRFQREIAGPGMVEIDEGQIGYFGAGRMLGGQIALHDLAEIRLLCLHERHHWRLKSADGQALLVPVDAAGAGRLYDAFASLPDIEMGRLTAALDQRVTAQTLWTRPRAQNRNRLDLPR